MTHQEQQKIYEINSEVNKNNKEIKKIKQQLSKLKKELENEEGLGYSEVINHKDYKKLKIEMVKIERKNSSLNLSMINFKEELRKKYQ